MLGQAQTSLGAPPVSQPVNNWPRGRNGEGGGRNGGGGGRTFYQQPPRRPRQERQQTRPRQELQPRYRQPQSPMNYYGSRRPLNLQHSSPMIVDDRILRSGVSSPLAPQTKQSQQSSRLPYGGGKSSGQAATQTYGRYRLRLVRQFTTLASKAFYTGVTLSLPHGIHLLSH